MLSIHGTLEIVSRMEQHLLRTALTVLMTTTLSGCLGYVPGRQTYWDAKVKEMCEKDGGVTIYDRIRISKADIDRRLLPMTADGKLSVAVKEDAHPDAPVYAVSRISYLREGNPQVRRTEHLIMRRTDQSVVAKWVFYSRIGGDFPTGFSEAPGLICPDLHKMTSDLQPLFIVEGNSK